MSLPVQPVLPLDALLRCSGIDRAVTTTVQPGSTKFYRGEGSRVQFSPLTTASQLLGVSLRTVNRWSVAGIPLRAAEDACDVLSLHPCEVWGDEWIDACLGSA